MLWSLSVQNSTDDTQQILVAQYRNGTLVCTTRPVRTPTQTVLMNKMNIAITRARSYLVNPTNNEAEWAEPYHLALEGFTSQTGGFAMVSDQKRLYLLHDSNTDPGPVAASLSQIQLVVSLSLKEQYNAPLMPMLLLGEYKRSPPRYMIDLVTGRPFISREAAFVAAVITTLHKSASQAMMGGTLALRRVPEQSHIILLATCGEWFTWRIMARTEMLMSPSETLAEKLTYEKRQKQMEDSNEFAVEVVDDTAIQTATTIVFKELTQFPIWVGWQNPVQLSSADGLTQLNLLWEKLGEIMDAYLRAYPHVVAETQKKYSLSRGSYSRQ
ncbi:hypothetical protein BKA62DRAFT_677585 [Auriculariales sp. MPI-PUGE-AT-0066]|nr:hypothetical protein BKA62DRAFT_677585 [Auriculariales sp. MPI-PUGE-AT-0066]